MSKNINYIIFSYRYTLQRGEAMKRKQINKTWPFRASFFCSSRRYNRIDISVQILAAKLKFSSSMSTKSRYISYFRVNKRKLHPPRSFSL